MTFETPPKNRPCVGLFGEVNLSRLGNRWWPAVVALICLHPVVAQAQDRQRPPARGPTRSRSATVPADRDARAREPASADESASKNTQAPLTLLDLIDYAEPSRAAMEEVKDYTAVFTKKELVKGRLITQVMDMKFRTKPFSVYFKYRSGPEAGRQAIFVEGKYGNKLLVKEVGIKAVAGVMPLALDSPMVMAENRYPVTNVGIGNVLKTALAVWERESKLDTVDVDVKFFPKAKLGELPVEAVQITHLKPHRDIKYSLSRVYFDKETKLPLRAERFGWPRQAGEKLPLVEDYIYTNLKTNVKLTDADFDPARYGF